MRIDGRRHLEEILANKGLGVFKVPAILSRAESWHKNAYHRRRRARRAAEHPLKHRPERLIAAAQLLQRHHGSTVPGTLSAAIMAPKKFICNGCGWLVSVKTAAKACKERGNCGGAWCQAAIIAKTVRPANATLKAAADVPRPSAKTQVPDAPAKS